MAPSPFSTATSRAAAIAVLAGLLGINLSGWIFFLPSALSGRADFRQLYTAGYMVRTGHARQLYDYETQKSFQDQRVSPEAVALPFNHLACEALMYLPFSCLSYRVAYFVFLAFNLALLGLSIWLLGPYIRWLAEVSPALPVAVVVCFLPITVALMEGQDSIALLALLAGAAVSLDRGREMTAGLLVGLGLFKFQIVLPVALLFLLWRRWKFAAGFAASATACAAVSFWVAGPAQMRVYARSLVSMSVELTSQVEHSRYGISPTAMPNLRGLLFGLAGARMPQLWLQLATVGASAALLLWVAARARRSTAGALACAIAAATAVSYHMLSHDLSVLLVPISVTLAKISATPGKGERILTVATVFAFLAPVNILFLGSYFYLAALPILAFAIVLALGRSDHGSPGTGGSPSPSCLFNNQSTNPGGFLGGPR